jgi:MFS family permease
MNSLLFHDLHPTTRRLLLARTVRSIGQGALVVDFALYLHTLEWSGVAIGLVLGASSLGGAGLSLLIGVTSDRLRRKPFLLAYEGVLFLGGVAALMTSEPLILVLCAIAGQFGRGAMGAAGPFSPAEQAWLAEEVAPERRGWVYSLNAGLGFGGMALGAIFAVLPSYWNHWLPGPLTFRPLFGLVVLTTVANLALLAKATERYEGTGAMQGRGGRGNEEKSIRWQENRILSKLVLINSLNGVAVGLTGPLISYWFALRFHVGPA